MTNLRQVAQQALEALESAAIFVDSFRGQKATQEAITALQTELAQPEQEPVAWMKEDWTGGHLNYECVYERAFAAFPVYKHSPAQRKPLTDEEIQAIWDVASGAIPGWSRHIAYARAIEAAHGIKEQQA
jgi:hypothetical protein